MMKKTSLLSAIGLLFPLVSSAEDLPRLEGPRPETYFFGDVNPALELNNEPVRLQPLAQESNSRSVPTQDQIVSINKSNERTVDDSIFRFELGYEPGFLGGRNVHVGGDDYTINAQRLDISTNIGIHQTYGLFEASMSGYDKVNSLENKPNFSALGNKLSLGFGRELDSWYRAEGDIIFLRHKKVLPGVRARLKGDLRGANYSFMQHLDFVVGVDVIDHLPHVEAKGGITFMDCYHVSGGGRWSPDRLRAELGVGLNILNVDFGARIGVEGFYHKFYEGRENGVMTKLSLSLPRFPKL
jgi:hypothetical protein